jgi:chromate transporter
MIHLLLLYFEFFKVGLFAVGGGLATLPFLFLMANDRFTFVQEAGWLGSEQIGNFLAIAQCSPGAVGVNMAAQAGFQYSGVLGGIAAVLGLISPAIIIITLVAKVLMSMKENTIVASVFSGLRPAATGLLTAAGWGVWRLSLYNPDNTTWHEIIRWQDGLVCLVIFVFVVKFKKHPVMYIALGAAAGIVMGLIL